MAKLPHRYGTSPFCSPPAPPAPASTWFLLHILSRECCSSGLQVVLRGGCSVIWFSFCVVTEEGKHSTYLLGLLRPPHCWHIFPPLKPLTPSTSEWNANVSARQLGLCYVASAFCLTFSRSLSCSLAPLAFPQRCPYTRNFFSFEKLISPGSYSPFKSWLRRHCLWKAFSHISRFAGLGSISSFFILRNLHILALQYIAPKYLLAC